MKPILLATLFLLSNVTLAQTKKIALPVLLKQQVSDIKELHLPVEGDVAITYFHGPRIFNSWSKADEIEGGVSKKAVQIDLKKTARQRHTGVDFSTTVGTPVYAAGDGRVVFSGVNSCLGNAIVIEHKDRDKYFYSVYAHLSEIQKVQYPIDPKLVAQKLTPQLRLEFPKKKATYIPPKGYRERNLTAGDEVKGAQLIALSGKSGAPLAIEGGKKTGCISGPHLHFELRVPREGDWEGPITFEKYGEFYKATIDVNPGERLLKIQKECEDRRLHEVRNNLRARLQYIDNLNRMKTKPKWARQQLEKVENIDVVTPLTAGECNAAFEAWLGHFLNTFKGLPLDAQRYWLED